MLLTLKIRLFPSESDARSLLKTMEAVNAACNWLSEVAYETRIFRRMPMHYAFYYQIRQRFGLSATSTNLLIPRVAAMYSFQKNTKCIFRPRGSVSCNQHTVAFKSDYSGLFLSISTIDGRLKLPVACNPAYRSYLNGHIRQSDLVLRNNKWFLHLFIERPEQKLGLPSDVLGVDLGIIELAYDSDGNHYSGRTINKLRHRHRAIRRKLQRKGTKSAKRLLRKRRYREARFASDLNHCISKRIIQCAKRTNRAIAIEHLNGIRTRVRARKRQRSMLHSWGFAQLGEYLTYKAALNGVALVQVDPRNTSKRCNKCGHIEKANRKSQSVFVCKKCGHTANADENGARNIRLKGLELLSAGALNHPNAEATNYGKIRDRTHLQATSGRKT